MQSQNHCYPVVAPKFKSRCINWHIIITRTFCHWTGVISSGWIRAVADLDVHRRLAHERRRHDRPVEKTRPRPAPYCSGDAGLAERSERCRSQSAAGERRTPAEATLEAPGQVEMMRRVVVAVLAAAVMVVVMMVMMMTMMATER